MSSIGTKTRSQSSAVPAENTSAESAKNVSASAELAKNMSMDLVLEKLNGIENEQKALRQTMNDKFESLKKDLLENITKSINDMKVELEGEINKVKEDCQELRQSVEILQSQQTKPIDDIDRTIVITNLKADNDTLQTEVEKMVQVLGFTIPTDVTIEQVKRLPGRDGKPGIVKVAFNSLESKVKVLKVKQQLRSNPEYSKCWLRTSKTHAERVAEMNFQKLLDMWNEGDQYKLTGNGRIVHKDDLYEAGSGRGGSTRGGRNFRGGSSFRCSSFRGGSIPGDSMLGDSMRGGGTRGGGMRGAGTEASRGDGIGRGERFHSRGGLTSTADYSLNDINPRDPNRPDTY